MQSFGTYFNCMDNISGTNNFWIVFNMGFVRCQGDRTVEDSSVFCEGGLYFMYTGGTCHSSHLLKTKALLFRNILFPLLNMSYYFKLKELL